MIQLTAKLVIPPIPMFTPGASAPILAQEVTGAFTSIVGDVAEASRAATPVAFGVLRASIGTRVGPGASAGIFVQGDVFTGAEAPYAEFVAYGSRPHYPPIAPLKRWAQLKLGNADAAYAIARAIARRGTRPHVRFRDAMTTFPPDVQARVEVAVARAARRLSGEA
jgi:hypothetical protein